MTEVISENGIDPLVRLRVRGGFSDAWDVFALRTLPPAGTPRRRAGIQARAPPGSQ
ncbi:MAG TPA: hypothetical protein VMA77_12375 [Solirubrobacteraceae bacterium]|nr:hypothetical protein [Solirubrobacteraceae bacterium]